MNSLDNTPELEEQSTWKLILFSTGYFLNTYLMIAFNNFVWTYYEGELGIINIVSLWPIYMALANTIYTIWSMLTNPFIGYLTDKPLKWTKRWGFHTPWIILGSIPAIVLFFFLFVPPISSGAENAILVFIYYIVIVSLYDLFYSLIQTHSYGAFAAHFRGDRMRRKGGILTQIFSFIANFLAITIFSQMIKPGDKESYTIAAFISIIILAISLFFFIPGSKETKIIKERFIIGYENAERVSFIKTMKMALKEKNFMLVVLSYISFMIAIGLTSMNAVNFVDDVLEEEQYIRSIGSIMMLISSFIAMPIWIRVTKKIGHSNAYSIGLVFFGASLLFYMIIINAVQYYILNILNGMTATLFLIMLSPITADCYDEIAVKTKKHHETTLLGVRNFFLRVTIPIQSFIIAIIHAITFYLPNEPSHKIEVIIGLRIIQGLIPSIFCIVCALIFYRWFDLKGNKKNEIIRKLHELKL
ncbi:MAG: MFS transporter [Promethearchaeota archaeon]